MGDSVRPSGPEAPRGLPWLGSVRSYLSTEAVNAVATLVGVVVLTRLVPPETYGAYSVTIAAASVAMALTGEWLQTATLRLVAGQHRPEHRRTYVRALLELTGASCGVLLLGGLLGLLLAEAPLARALIVAGWLYATLNVLFLGTTIYFQATLQSARFARYRSAYSILRVVLAAGFAALIAPSPVWLVGGSVAALALLLPPAALRLVRGSGTVSDVRTAAARAAVLRFGAPLIGWYAASQTLNLADRFFLQGLRGSAEVGIYSVTYALVVGATTTLLQPVLAAAYPQTVRAWHLEGPTAAGRHLGEAMRIFVLLAPLLFCGLSFFGVDVLAVLAPRAYHTPAALIGLLTAALLCWNAGLYIQKGLELTLRTTALVKALGLAALVNMAANLLLIPRYGLLGSAAATLLGYLIYVGLVLRLSRTAFRFPLPIRGGAAAAAAAIAFSAVSLLLERAETLQSHWGRLLVAAPLATLAYTGLLYAVGELRLPLPRIATRPAGPQ